MKIEPNTFRTPAQLLALAKQYAAAAEVLRKDGPRGEAIRWAPYRLCTIHAVELCLSALLLHAGHPWKAIVNMQHDLAQRARIGMAHGLTLQKRSIDMLEWLSEHESYKAVRYTPASLADGRHPDEIWAVLQDVAAKVRRLTSASPIMPLPASA